MAALGEAAIGRSGRLCRPLYQLSCSASVSAQLQCCPGLKTVLLKLEIAGFGKTSVCA